MKCAIKLKNQKKNVHFNKTSNKMYLDVFCYIDDVLLNSVNRAGFTGIWSQLLGLVRWRFLCRPLAVPLPRSSHLGCLASDFTDNENSMLEQLRPTIVLCRELLNVLFCNGCTDYSITIDAKNSCQRFEKVPSTDWI